MYIASVDGFNHGRPDRLVGQHKRRHTCGWHDYRNSSAPKIITIEEVWHFNTLNLWAEGPSGALGWRLNYTVLPTKTGYHDQLKRDRTAPEFFKVLKPALALA